MNADPASLANLNDIVMLPAPSWWPPAPGWYMLAALLFIALVWSGYRHWAVYRCNRYRRAALAELAGIEMEPGHYGFDSLPVLLKRTALHAYSREQIASLSGNEWREFLNLHCDAQPFSEETWARLDSMAYRSDDTGVTDLEPLIRSIRLWIKRHRADQC